MKKTTGRIGLALPPKNTSKNNSSGNGLIPVDVRDDLLSKLEASPEINDIIHCDLQNAHIKNGKVYDGDTCLSDLDLVCWYYFTEADPTAWEHTVLNTLSQTTTVIPDPKGHLTGRDKFRAHTCLRNAGIDTADFSLFRASEVHKAVDSLADWDTILLKPTLGDFGQGIHMVKTAQAMIDAVEYTQSFSPKELLIFCEKFEENDLDKWVSATVIDGEVVLGYKKKMETFVDNWKVYDPGRMGGRIDYVDPSPVEDIALAAAQVMGCDIIGFDFVYSTEQEKYLIVDENTFPGMYQECFEASGKGSWSDHFHRMIMNHLCGNYRMTVLAERLQVSSAAHRA